MRTKTTLILLAAACGLLGFIQFYEVNRPNTREKAERGDYLFTFDQNSIDGIIIAGNEDKIELRKNGSQWELKSPVKDRADASAVGELLSRSDMLHIEATVAGKRADKKQLKEFGVAKSSLRLKLLGQGAPRELLFGKKTAVDGKIYVRVEGSGNVYVVSDELHNLVARKADDFRDHQLSEIDGAHVDKVALKTPAGEIEMARKDGHWELNKPLKARADDAAAVDLIGSILKTPIISFAPDKGANLNSYGLSEPRATVTLWAQGREKPVVLEIGGHDSKTDQTYARLSSRGSVYLLPKRVERILTLKPNDFRDRHLLRVNLDIVDRITVEPAGKPKIILQRRQETWAVKEGASEKPANPARVQELVKALQTQKISGFLADSPSDLAKYGLDHPRLRVTFSSYASENTAEGNAGEQPITTIAFGALDGANVYARVENEPFVVAIDKSILEPIYAEAAQWRALSLFGLKPEEIVALETAYPGDPSLPPVSLVRDGGGWKLAAGGSGTVQKINLQSFLNTLAPLSALAWNGGEESPSGVKTPSETIAFKTAGGKSYRLTLGRAQAGQPCNAALKEETEETGSFTINAPDESALRLPLVTPEAAASR